MAKTQISWCDYTFNPWRGCSRASAGCDHCYAEQMAKRNPKVFGTWGPGPQGNRVVGSDAYWKLPRRWNREAAAAGLEGNDRPRVFCGSMMDVFEDRPDLVHWRAGLFEVIDETGNLQWMLLTKRPENIRRLMPPFVVQYRAEAGDSSYIEGVRENVWLGATIENDAVAAKRLGHLLRVPAARRFLSLEPLLGPIDLAAILARQSLSALGRNVYGAIAEDRRNATAPSDMLHEVIIGGESGPNARPCRIEWIKDLLAQCDAVGIPCYVKQLGSDPRLDDPTLGRQGEALPIRARGKSDGGIRDRKGGDPAEWPKELQVRAYAAKTK
jgi:protein gp37